jgi:N-acetylneuraminic acid mutarotase
MWVFETGKDQWRKVLGSATVNDKPTYDQLSENTKTSSPGGRSGSCTWVDSDGNLWLFGGESQDGKNIITYNDLWRFDQKKESWHRMAGADKPNQVLDSASIAKGSKKAQPSSRRDAIAWYDKGKNQLYLYGGVGYGLSSGRHGNLADMWAYDVKSNNWIVKSKIFQTNSEPVNFSAGGFSSRNTPGGRKGAVHWVDRAGDFYLMGGYNVLYKAATFIDPYVWKFDIKKELWTMVLDSESVVLSDGTVFEAADGSVYLYGGNEFDKQNRQSYPVTSVWLLEQK